MITSSVSGGPRASDRPYVFKPHEQPALPGSPYSPAHPPARRVAYAVTGVLAALTGGLGNALVSANLTYVQAWLGLYSDQVYWLVVVYVTTNVCANLVLVKVRQQFGLQPFMRWMLTAYVLVTLVHLFIEGFWSAIVVRAVSGVAAAGLSALGLLNIMQAAPASNRTPAMIIGVGIPSLAIPVARVISPALLAWDAWRMTYYFELGLALATLAAILILPLPPSVRQGRVFERMDFLTVALLFPGVACLCSVLGLGRILWWTSRPWIAFAAIAAIVLISAALLIEHYRTRPLLMTRWLRHPMMVVIASVLIVIRILASEPSFASIGLLSVLGIGVDQLESLYLWVTAASLVGIGLAALTFTPEYPGRALLIAFALTAIGAFMDAGSTSLTRPGDMVISQSLIAIGTLVAIGPLFVIGMSRMFLEGSQAFISWVVLFNATQNIGSLMGPAIFGTVQVAREKFHSSMLTEQMVLTNPLIAQTMSGSQRALGSTVTDPALRSAEGAASIAQKIAVEANVLAYNDVFMLAGMIAIAGLIAAIALEVWAIATSHKSSVVRFREMMQQRAVGSEPVESGGTR